MAILDGLKMAADTLRQADKIPQYEAVLDAYAQIADLQTQNHQQQREIRELTMELECLRTDQVSAEGSEIWRELLWIKGDNDPYCVHCFDKDKRLFHVFRARGKAMADDTVCPECKNRTERAPTKSVWQVEREQRIDRSVSQADEID